MTDKRIAPRKKKPYQAYPRHKITPFEVLCGSKAGLAIAWYWKDVNCEECLKLKGKKK